MNKDEIVNYLNKIISNPVCELNYSKDYELLISVMLSAQSTDKRVNKVTEELYNKYSNIYLLNEASVKEIETIIKPIGTYKRKSFYIKEIVANLIKDWDGRVPRDRNYLEQLPGIGRKSTNVVLAELYNLPTIAVDTHVTRISKRLGLANENDSVRKIEEKLMKIFPQKDWNKINHQLILFGRYYCKARNPDCENCLLKKDCIRTKKETVKN
ncbi:MAG: endonuclease III [Tenericutes bacterium]|jgi:endonuclease-3|nr:endonuclease III [Mycoplasmatota bacterium]